VKEVVYELYSSGFVELETVHPGFPLAGESIDIDGSTIGVDGGYTVSPFGC
jgi:hypothetical protein